MDEIDYGKQAKHQDSVLGLPTTRQTNQATPIAARGATILTLIVLPALFRLAHGHKSAANRLTPVPAGS